ncbi:MAG: hypothetical protein ABJ360_04625 [Roseobacter sp.]
MVKHVIFGGYQRPNSVHIKGVQIIANAVARLTEGEVQVVFEQILTKRGVPATLLFDMVENDEIDGFYFSSSYLTDRAPALVMFDQHFAVPSHDKAYGLFDGALGQGQADAVRSGGVDAQENPVTNIY